MTFPKRWLEDEHAASSLRDVLRADRDMEPPADAEKAVWAALVAQIGAASAGAAAAGASAKGAATVGSGAAAGSAAGTGAVTAVGGGLLKSILIGTFTGIVAVSGYSALEPASPPRAAPSSDIAAPVAPGEKAPSKSGPASIAPGPTSVASSAPGPGVLSTYSGEPSPAPGPVSRTGAGGGEPSGAASAQAEPAGGAPAPLPGSAEERESRLREESEMLRQARAALRGGDTGGAMRLLEQARQKFPGGVLGQEREALAIETLAKSGARDVASARAAAFIQAHPQSPHAARLQVYVQP